MENLETNRLIIRNFCAEDAPPLRSMMLKYAASEYAKYDHQWPTSEEEIRDITNWFSGGDSFLAVCRKEDGEFLGFIALNKNDNADCSEYDLGYIFDSAYHGHGYATEGCQAILKHAFSTLQADRVTSGTALANVPSCRLLARLGMRKVGESTVSFHQTPDGKPIEFTGGAFALTREDWQKQS